MPPTLTSESADNHLVTDLLSNEIRFLNRDSAFVEAEVFGWDEEGQETRIMLRHRDTIDNIEARNVETFYENVKQKIYASKFGVGILHGDGRLNDFTLPGAGSLSEVREQSTPFGTLCKALGLSSQFEEQVIRPALLQNNGAFSTFTDWKENGSESMNILFFLPNSPVENIFLVLRFTEQRTTALIIVRTATFIKPTFDLLHSNISSILSFPPILLGLIFSKSGANLEQYRAMRDHKLVLLEQRILRSDNNDYKNQDNFLTLMAESKANSQKLFYLRNLTAFEIRAAVWIEEVYTQYSKTFDVDGLEVVKAREILLFHTNLAILRDQQSQSLMGRLQVARELLFSVISQRDSAISTEIAHQSREIAQSSLKDSFAMKTLAALNMIFLPTVVIATIFSANIIPDAESAKTFQQRQSIFAGAAVALTIVTACVWWGFLRSHGRRTAATSEKIDRLGEEVDRGARSFGGKAQV